MRQYVVPVVSLAALAAGLAFWFRPHPRPMGTHGRGGLDATAIAAPRPTTGGHAAPLPSAAAPRPAKPAAAPPSPTMGAQEHNRWLIACASTDDAGRPVCHRCYYDRDCAVGEACAVDRASGTKRCMAPDCTTDNDCFAGWSCRAVGSEQRIKRCVEHGAGAEGAPCLADPLGPALSCEEGLVCVKGRCAPPCPGKACANGAACIDTPDGPACWKAPETCKTAGCGSGLTCESLGGDAYACLDKAHTRGKNCFTHPCPNGQVCAVTEGGGQAAFWCTTPCDPLAKGSCPKGQICGVDHRDAARSHCYVDCTTNDAICKPDEVCMVASEDGETWGCTPAVDEMMHAGR